MRIMSLSLIAFQPAIEEPSNMKPSVSMSSSMTDGDHRQVLPLALGVGEAKVDIFDLIFLDLLQHFGRGARHDGPRLDEENRPRLAASVHDQRFQRWGDGVTSGVNI